MDLEGKYEWVNSKRTGKPIISFVLHSTRWLRDEHFDVMLQDAAGMRAPKVFANLTLEHGKSYRFDFDTVDWNWQKGDCFVITRRNGKAVNLQWMFNASGPDGGDCPECHGTHICSACNGRGTLIDSMHNVQTCQRCHGTGRCQTCYIPAYGEQNPADGRKERRVQVLRQQIMELNKKIEQAQWDLRMMELNNVPSPLRHTTPNYSIIQSQNQLIFGYQTQLGKLQHELQQLENQGL